jgi:hypothetical protein
MITQANLVLAIQGKGCTFTSDATGIVHHIVPHKVTIDIVDGKRIVSLDGTLTDEEEDNVYGFDGITVIP